MHFKTTMHFKSLLLLPGALALALTATPLRPVAAQTMAAPSGQMQQHGGRLNLTTAQKAQLKQIKSTTHSQINAVLTPAQQAKYASAKNERQERQVWSTLNLTADQKTKIRTIRQSAKQQMDAVLTPAQRQQVQQQQQQH